MKIAFLMVYGPHEASFPLGTIVLLENCWPAQEVFYNSKLDTVSLYFYSCISVDDK